jgi:hypothetical protein
MEQVLFCFSKKNRYSRWLQLTEKAAFTPNAAVQPRALVMFGTLMANPELATREVVQRLAHVLAQTVAGQEENEDLGVATLMAVCSIVPQLDDDLSKKNSDSFLKNDKQKTFFSPIF